MSEWRTLGEAPRLVVGSTDLPVGSFCSVERECIDPRTEDKAGVGVGSPSAVMDVLHCSEGRVTAGTAWEAGTSERLSADVNRMVD